MDGYKRAGIIGVAIKRDDGKVDSAGRDFYFLIPPNRHHNLIKHIYLSEKRDGPVTAEQGFVTNKLKFISRKDTYKLLISLSIKSIAPGGYRGIEAFSEDMW